MRNLFFVFITVLACSSCVTTLYPFITNEPGECLPLKKELTGRWQMDSLTVRIEPLVSSPLRMDDQFVKNALLPEPSKSKERLRDSIYLTRQYLVSYSKDNIRYVYQCGLTNIGGQLFMEIQPQQAVSSNFDVQPDLYNFQRTYALARIRLENYTIQAEFLDGEYIKNQIMSGNMRIGHEHEQLFDSFVITARTAELRAFIAKYGKDERLYKNGNRITLTRKNLYL